MNRGKQFALAAVIVLATASWNSRVSANDQPQNPVCDQQVLLKRGSSTIQSSSNLRFNIHSMNAIGSCVTTVDAIHLVASPSGLADTTATGPDFPGLFVAPVETNSTTPVSVAELWLEASEAYDAPEFASTQVLECDDPVFSLDYAPIFYVQLASPDGSALVHPTAATNGRITIADKFCTDNFDQTLTYCYGGFLDLPARSTDRDGDGDTDEDDENGLRNANDNSADLNFNGTNHDAEDIAIVVREENRRDANGHPFHRGQCVQRSDTSPFSQLGNYHMYRPATPSVSTTAGCYQVEIQWADTGDDSLTGQATFYSVRQSTSAITTANWESATEIATGTPGPSGTAESVFHTGLAPCSSHYYYAVRLKDDVGNWSAIGSAQGWTLCPHFGSCEDGLIAGGGSEEADAPTFALAHGTPTTLLAPVDLGFEIPRALRGGDLSLDIMDLNGRIVRHLDGGVPTSASSVVHWDLRRNDGGNAPAGVYFMRARLGVATTVQRLVVIR